MPPPITLGPVSDEDHDFAYRLFAATKAAEMGAQNWDESQLAPLIDMQFRAQAQSHRTEFPDADDQIVRYDDEPVGRLIVARTAESIHLVEIALLPEYQRRGIGTHLIEQLQQEARAKSRPITAHVFVMNPAVHFYQKLGFTISADAPPQYLAEWRGSED